MRMLASEAKIDIYRLLSGQIGQKEYGQITHALETLSEAQLFIDDTAGIGALEMRAKARRLKAEHGLSVLAIDYIQLMTGRGRFENRTLELASISRSLKGLAKELSVPIVVLSQLSRAPEARSDKRPMLSDLRESGALEQDADVVVLIFREEMYKIGRSSRAETDGVAEIIIAKQRNGPTGTVKLAFIREQTRFGNLAGGGYSSTTNAEVSVPSAALSLDNLRPWSAAPPRASISRRSNPTSRRSARISPDEAGLNRGAGRGPADRARHHRRRQGQRLRTRRAPRGARRSKPRARRCWRWPTSRKASIFARPASARRSWSSARSASAISTACSITI